APGAEDEIALRRAAARRLPRPIGTDRSAPQRIALTAERFRSDGSGLGRSRDHHDELEFGVDEDRLAVDAEQSKSPLLTRKQPEQVAIAEISRGLSRRERVGLPVRIGR